MLEVESEDVSGENSLLPDKSLDIKKTSPNLFSRLIDRIKNSFVTSKSSSTARLAGRIHERESKSAVKILDKFLAVARRMESRLDPELVGHVQAAMELITRDFRRIQKKATNGSEEESEKVYTTWMVKAKRWIELDTKLHDRAAIIDIVMKQLFLDLDDLIDQDLQVIFDYESHILADLSVSHEEKSKLEQMILATLAPHTQALIKLKEHPDNLELYKVARWKEEVDLRRQKYFDKALQSIDAIIASFLPSTLQAEEEEEQNPAVQAMATQMENFHNACLDLLNSAQKLEADDEGSKKAIRATLLLLQQQAHGLNANLHLTHALFDRLQTIQENLERIESRLNNPV